MEILYIVFGAVLLLNTLRASGAIQAIRENLLSLSGDRPSIAAGLSAWKVALFAGVAFTVPCTLTAIALDPEFPTLVGGLLGLALVIFAVQRGWFVPEPPWDFPPAETWDKSWQGSTVPSLPSAPASMGVLKAWLPYGLVGALLVVSRVVLPVKTALQSVQIRWDDIFNTSLAAVIQPLYLPPTILVVVVVLTYGLHQMQPGDLRQAFQEGLPVMRNVTLALGAAVLMARTFINLSYG